MNWKIFYAGGITFSGSDGRQDAPARGVIAIVQDDPDHISQVVSGGDFYVWWHDRWQALAHIYDLWDYAIEMKFLPPDSPASAIHDKMDWMVKEGYVKIGRMTTQAEYNRTMKQANIERTAWRHWERKYENETV